MGAREATEEFRRWSGPINHLDEIERRLLADSMLPNGRPRIEILDALRNNWFEIWYQPKIDLKRKCLAGAEALARIRHPVYGMLLPSSFLPDCNEESVARLTEHALLATLRNWSIFDAAGFNLHLAINVPVSALLNLPVAALVREYRPKSERWPGLILEVSEDQIVRDIKRAHSIAEELRACGVTIAIDDFGAGYSSFTSLRELPFAELKLDRSFVKNCASDATNAAICQTAIDLAHRFGSAAVAEGIESMADIQAMVVMGCDFGQGVLIAPPMPQERFIGLLRQRMNKPRMPDAPPPVAENDDHVAAPGALRRVAVA
jgi:EAL domain-containing protein (putative c-di-GMP-specific phosphodiesterase class I)